MEADELKEKIIQEVAKKHHVLLGPDDPVLVTVTIHEEIFKQHVSELKKAVNSTSESMEEISFQYQEQSKKLAQTVVGAAVNDVAERVRKEADTAGKLFSASMEGKLSSFEARQKKAQYGMWMAAAISVFGMLGTITFVALLA
jgi:actin-like ATPase involved in cell morphogenesis